MFALFLILVTNVTTVCVFAQAETLTEMLFDDIVQQAASNTLLQGEIINSNSITIDTCEYCHHVVINSSSIAIDTCEYRRHLVINFSFIAIDTCLYRRHLIINSNSITIDTCKYRRHLISNSSLRSVYCHM